VGAPAARALGMEGNVVRSWLDFVTPRWARGIPFRCAREQRHGTEKPTNSRSRWPFWADRSRRSIGRPVHFVPVLRAKTDRTSPLVLPYLRD